MPLVVETGAGLADANAYAAVAQADAFLDGDAVRRSAWAALSTTDKEALLISATRALDHAFHFVGDKASTAQALEWPRTRAIGAHGGYWPEGAVPPPVVNATALFAASLMAADTLADGYGRQVEREKVDVIEVTYAKDTPALPRIPDRVRFELRDCGAPRV